jgi:hypothetical protein
MKNLVIGVVVGALVGALVGYLVWGRHVSQLDTRVAELESKLAAAPVPATAPVVATAVSNKRATAITITGATGSQCVAAVDQPLIGNKPAKRVLFVVDSEDSTCGAGNWRIQLKFHDIPASGSTPAIPYNATNNPLDIGRDDLSRIRLFKGANVGRFKYEVWYYQPGGTTYKMLDPELEIEP